MELPLPLVVTLVNLLLVAGGLIVFLPENVPFPSRRKDAERLLDKYGKYLLAAVAVLVLHLLVVQVDAAVTRALGWDFAPQLDALDDDLATGVVALWNPVLNYFFSIVLVALHPFMLYFPVLLFILSDEERPAKAVLLAYPLAYLMALPFYLLFPVTNVYIHHDVQSPVFELFPDLTAFYLNATTDNNAFPSLHVAFALLIGNAARFARNRRFRIFAYVYAIAMTLATIYLAMHWLADVVGGVVVALLAATFTRRFISTERLALQRVKPTPEEAHHARDAADRLVARVDALLAERRIPGSAMLVGSVAKDTYLRDGVDYDVFVLLPPDLPREEFERVGLEIGRAALDDPEEKYAEHPYIHGYWEGVEADVVPCYAVPTAAARLSAVDRTPFHTRFVLERMEREQRDQVRLLKAFMKGVGVYGAEAATQGFSGYLCELLVLKFRSFRGVVHAASGWKPGTFLVLERYEGNPRFGDPLVFLDPVDPKRNAASAVSAETLAQLAEACRAYLRREGLSYFFPRQLVPQPPDELALVVRRRRGDFVLIRTRTPDVLEDHLHDQLRKAAAAVKRLLEQHEFEVRRVTYEINAQVKILVELPRVRLSETATHVGPPVRARDHAERFRKTWSDHPAARSPVYEEDGRLKVERVREFRRADDLLRARLLEFDLGKHLNAALAEGYEVLAGLDVVQEDTAQLLTRHLTRRKAWEI